MKDSKEKDISRRNLIGTASTAVIGITIVSVNVLGRKFGFAAPSDKLRYCGYGNWGNG